MACCNTNMTNNTTSTRAYLFDTIARIDQLQKEATLQTACEGCEGSLVTTFYNTKPVTFYLSGGATFTVTVPLDGGTTSVFRIEEVRGDSVVLRLLVADADTFTCTNYTVILRMECICALQCFPPICCDTCTRNCGQ